MQDLEKFKKDEDKEDTQMLNENKKTKDTKAKQRNPRLKKNINWGKYQFDKLVDDVISGYDIPKTKIPWQEWDEKMGVWKNIEREVNNTEAMQYVRNTDYTHAQLKKHLEEEGYKIQRVVMPINCNKKYAENDVHNTSTRNEDSKDVQKIVTKKGDTNLDSVMQDLWLQKDEIKRIPFWCHKNDYERFLNIIKTYQNGKRKYAGAAIIKLAIELLSTHNLSSNNSSKQEKED